MSDWFPTNEDLTSALVRDGFIKTPLIREAFLAIDRKDFVPMEYQSEAYANYPLPIGEGQTISQPLTVAFLLELLQPKPGQKLLDVGAGSGWATALLAYIVYKSGEKGRVIAIERVSSVSQFGERNVRKYNFVEKGIVRWITGDGSLGLPEESPFDGILAGASARELPPAWREQVKVGGRIVTPIGSSVWLFVKKPALPPPPKQPLRLRRPSAQGYGEAQWEEKEYPGFAFVPLISDKS